MKRSLFLLFSLLFCLNLASPMTLVQAQSSAPRRVPVVNIAKSGDGQVLAVTYYLSGGLVDFFDSATGNLIATVDLSPYAPLLIDLSPTGDRLLWADGDSRVGVYDIQTGNNTIIINGGMFFLAAIDWNPISELIAWTEGTSIRFYDMSTGEFLGTVASNAESIAAFAWSPDGQSLVSSHFANDSFNPGEKLVTAQVWDVSTISGIMTRPVTTIDDHGGGRVAWSPDGTRFATLEQGGIFVYDLTTHVADKVEITESGLSVVAWSPDGSKLATGGSVIRTWNTNTWQLEQKIAVDGGVRALHWSPDSQHIFNDGGPDGLYLDEIALADIHANAQTPTETPTPATK